MNKPSQKNHPDPNFLKTMWNVPQDFDHYEFIHVYSIPIHIAIS